MKKNKTAIIILSLTTLLYSSCQKVQKDVNDYFPEIKTISATVQTDGSVELKGEIVSKGTTDIQYAGFCMDTLSQPDMLSNQLLSTIISDNIFTVVYSGFDPYKRFYFRAWAANDMGYSFGNIIYLDSIKATPVIAPCTPTLNTLNIGGGQPMQYFSTVASPSAGIDGWEVTANTDAGTYNFTFGSKPSTKIYTASTTPLGVNNVAMNFYSGFISGSLNYGDSVYVNQLSATKWQITLCNAAWDYNSSTFYMTGKFDCPK